MNKLRVSFLFRKHIFLSIAVILTITAGFTLQVVSNSFDLSLDSALSTYIEDYGYPDAVVCVDRTNADECEKLRNLDFVEDVNLRICAESSMYSNDGKAYSVVGYSFSWSDFSKFCFWEESDKKTALPEILLEYNFAKNNGFKAGDVVDVLLIEDKRISCFVRSIVSRPENLGIRNADGWGLEFNQACIYFNKKLLKDTEYAKLGNQFLFKFKKDCNQTQCIEDVCAVLGKDGIKVEESYIYNQSPVCATVTDNINPINVLCSFVPLLFFCFVLLVLFFTMYMFICLEQKEIGVYMSLGFLKEEIIFLFLRFVFVLSLVSIVLSYPVYKLIIRLLASIYAGYFPLPEMPCLLDKKSVIIAVLLVLTVDITATILGCNQITGLKPVDVISCTGKIYDAKFQNAICRIFKHLSPVSKFTLTTMVRSYKRFVFSVLCISVSIIIIFASFSLNSSNNYCLRELFEERINYDSIVLLRNSPSYELEEWLEREGAVEKSERGAYYKRKINGIDSVIIAVESENSMLKVNTDGSWNGIILEKNTADIIGAQCGDSVKIGDSTVTVSGISVQPTSKMQILKLDSAKELEDPDCYILFCNIGNRETFESALVRIPDAISVIYSGDEKNKAVDLFEKYDTPVEMLVIFSIVIGLIAISITSIISYFERIKETCVIFSQGFTVRDLLSGIFTGSSVQLCLAGIAGFPIGVLVAKTAFNVMNTERRTNFYVSGFKEIALTFCITALFIAVGNVISMYIIRKWNIAEKVSL